MCFMRTDISREAAKFVLAAAVSIVCADINKEADEFEEQLRRSREEREVRLCFCCRLCNCNCWCCAAPAAVLVCCPAGASAGGSG